MIKNQKQSAWIGIAVAISLGVFVYFTLRWLFAPVNKPQNGPAVPQQAEQQLRENGDPDASGSLPEFFSEIRAKRIDGEWQLGYKPDAAGTAAFLATLAKPNLAQAGPDLLAKSQDQKPILLYRALHEAYAATHNGREWRVGQQKIGDCVSWGWAHGADIHLAVMWKLGQSAEWQEAATESIYGGSRVESRGATRGGYSDGSYGGAAARWVKDWGIVFRRDYSEQKIDLTTYSGERAKSWGNFGNGGENDEGKFDAVAKKHPVRSVAVVRDFREAAAAIQAGYPVPVCSGQGFSSSRDKDGFCSPRGSWAHCMCFIGVRFDRPGLLCLNSWGPSWVSGDKWPADQPDGSFWVDEATATRMLRGGDSFAVSGYEGFPYRDLANGDWVVTEPHEVKQFAGRIRNREQFVLAPR